MIENALIKSYLAGLIRHGIAALGVALVAHRASQAEVTSLTGLIDPGAIAGFLLALFSLCWSMLQKKTVNAQLTVPATVHQASMRPSVPLTVLVCLLGLALTTGCTHFVVACGTNKVATRVTVHNFGVNVGVSPANETPSVILGSSTVMVDYIPLSTNGVIYSPDLATTIDDENNGDPFTFSGTASVVSGHDAAYKANATNTVMAQPLFGSGTNSPAK